MSLLYMQIKLTCQFCRRESLNRLHVHACVLTLSHNFSWLTGGGRNYILQSTEGIFVIKVVDYSTECSSDGILHRWCWVYIY